MRADLDLSSLNPQQREAVQTTAGPVLLLAGAGTGKTRVITCRIAYLVAAGTAPQHLLAVTFTNKAAREMQERIASLLGETTAKAVTVGTFHSFCARLLRERIHLLGYNPNFAIVDDSYQVGLVRALMTELGCIGEGRNARLWLALISKAKCRLERPEDVRERESLQFAHDIASVYELYQQRLRQMDLLDFDDLLVSVLRLWEQRPDVLSEHQDRYQFLLIDEYQDTNTIQFRLMATLAGTRANICAVGDDDQSIYGWRGADVGNILAFDSHFPSAKVIRLEQNYRSTTSILTAANHVISRNRDRHEKRLWSDRGEGEKLLSVVTDNEHDEARFVAQVVREKQLQHKRPYSDFAVLFRSNRQAGPLETAFRKERIPYCVVGTRSFFQRKEVLDVVSLLRAVHNPKDDLSLLRILNVPPRGVGDRAVERLREWRHITGLPLQQLIVEDQYIHELPAETAASLLEFHASLERARGQFEQHGGLAGKARQLLDEVGYLEGLGRMYKPRSDALNRQENVHEFLSQMEDFDSRQRPHPSLRDFLESVSLLDANDSVEGKGGEQGAVTLMTVHAAKGLEFPVVIIVGMERGLFPHARSLEEHSEQEERRLFYVALTRAQQEVVLTHAQRRKIGGQVMRRRPSPFLDDLPEDLVLVRTAADAFEPASAEVASDFLARMKAMFDP